MIGANGPPYIRFLGKTSSRSISWVDLRGHPAQVLQHDRHVCFTLRAGSQRADQVDQAFPLESPGAVSGEDEIDDGLDAIGHDCSFAGRRVGVAARAATDACKDTRQADRHRLRASPWAAQHRGGKNPGGSVYPRRPRFLHPRPGLDGRGAAGCTLHASIPVLSFRSREASAQAVFAERLSTQAKHSTRQARSDWPLTALAPAAPGPVGARPRLASAQPAKRRRAIAGQGFEPSYEQVFTGDQSMPASPR